MLKITLAQMRRSAGRLVAAGIAITIATAFVAATLLAGGVITRATYDQIAAQYAQADLVAGTSWNDPFSTADVESLAAVDGVEAAAPLAQTWTGFAGGGRQAVQVVIPVAPDELMPLTIGEGRWPAAADEIALPPSVADRLGAEVGGTVEQSRDIMTGEGGFEPSTVRLTVVGLTDDPAGAYAQYGGAAVVVPDAFMAAYGQHSGFNEIGLLLSPQADLTEVRQAAAAAVGASAAGDRAIQTTDERAAQVAAEFTGGQDMMFLVFVLTFAAIALVVAGLVIANTFQVLVAQRARTLALLRCVGAGKGQVGRGVLVEAGILGSLASVAGVVLGIVLVQGALWAAGSLDFPLPSTVTIGWSVLVVPVLVGTVVTVASALVPARVATRVAPLAALRPSDAPTAARGAGRVRLVLSLLAVLGGGALLALGAALGVVAEQPDLGLLAGVLGGAISFVGVALSAVYWLPKVTGLVGRVAGKSGPTARLAAANTLRNPRRTAATSTALLIGVTLVAMMSTGAASARVSLNSMLDEQFPVDVNVATSQAVDDGAEPLPQGLAAQVAGARGVESVAPVTAALVDVVPGQDAGQALGDEMSVVGVDPDLLAASLNVGVALQDGEVTMSQSWVDAYGSGPVRLAGDAGELELDVVPADGALPSMMTLADLERLTGSVPPVSGLWVGLESGTDPVEAVAAIEQAASESGVSVMVWGPAVERVEFDRLVDTVLGIVLGLLAVAVVIALIGVANTLSLSVIERRRESATLRAIGLSQGQLRTMLSVEGVLIAGVGAVLGVLLGLIYGWAGSAAALGVMGDVVLAVPWREVALVLVVALVAGLVASVAPAQTALKTSPVEALAAD